MIRKKLVLIGLPSDCGGANNEAGHTALLWASHGIPVTILPVHPVTSDNPWVNRLEDAGCTVAAPSLDGWPPDWLKDCIVVDFACDRAIRLWPTLQRRGCCLIHCPTHTNLRANEDATFRNWPPTAVVCESAFQRSFLSLQFAAYGMGNLYSIPAAFDPDFFPHHPCPHNGKAFNVGVIARDDPAKWPPRLLRVLKAARQRAPAIRGRWMGWTPAMKSKSGTPPPWISHLPPGSLDAATFLADCHALAVFSDYLENWPRVILEAMAAGVPVLADNRGGIREMIDNRRTGLLCGDEEEAAAYLAMLASNESTRLAMIRAAQDSLTQLSPAEEIAEKWVTLFASL